MIPMVFFSLAVLFPTFNVGQGVTAPDQTAEVVIHFTPGDTPVAGAQFDLALPAGLEPEMLDGSAVRADCRALSNKQVFAGALPHLCEPGHCERVRVLIFSLTDPLTTVEPGPIAACRFRVTGADGQFRPLRCVDLIASTPANPWAERVDAMCYDGGVHAPSLDLNGDGRVDVGDVTLLIGEVLQ